MSDAERIARLERAVLALIDATENIQIGFYDSSVYTHREWRERLQAVREMLAPLPPNKTLKTGNKSG